MSPRPAPDLDLRREQVTRVARDVAEAEGWTAVTMRRLATEIGVTQPVLYSAFSGRQALVDAVAVDGFAAIAAALEAVDPEPMARMRAYLDFAAGQPTSTRPCSRCLPVCRSGPVAARSRSDVLLPRSGTRSPARTTSGRR
jgi:AcrR family transcriptional regulator